MSGHTPGKWNVEGGYAREGHSKGATVWASGMQICETGHADFDYANARLIAAAPEMLELLEEYFSGMLEGEVREGTFAARALAVLKKARGE